jgi:hypothetical protein
MGKLTKYDTGATRDSRDGKLVYDKFLSPVVLKQFAKYMNMNRVQSDGALRPGDNWQKGIAMEDYTESLHRHLMDFWMEHRGINTEPGILAAMCGIMFNVMGYMHEYLKFNPMQDFDGDEPTPEMAKRLIERLAGASEDLTDQELDSPCGEVWCKGGCGFLEKDCACDTHSQGEQWPIAWHVDEDVINSLLNDARATTGPHYPGDFAPKPVKISNIVGCNCDKCKGVS